MKRMIPLLLILALLTWCGGENTDNSYNSTSTESKENTYTRISSDEAAEMMSQETDYIILDVRTQAEYEEKHIPGAICVPNEKISTVPPDQLSDKEQLIMVYCRSGNRSKTASQKLADMGYTNIVEFGGIIDWQGETVTGSTP